MSFMGSYEITTLLQAVTLNSMTQQSHLHFLLFYRLFKIIQAMSSYKHMRYQLQKHV